MSEIAKCRCGATARITDDFAVARDPAVPEPAFGPRHTVPVPDGHYEIECLGECGVYVWARTVEEATARWNALMRPRPVAEWVPAQGLRGDEPHGFVGSLRLGQVVLGHVSVHGIVAARCHIDGKGQYFLDPDSASARAWLEERVKAAGFDVREESSRA